MAQAFITRERPLRRRFLYALLWSVLFAGAALYLLLTFTPAGEHLEEWWVSEKNVLTGHTLTTTTTNSATNQAKQQQQLRPDNRLTVVQMAPTILRPITTQTESGPLRGFVQNVSGVEIATFLSIPYGQPPVGKLRFRNTVPVEPWEETRDATYLPPPCIQSEYTQRLFPVHILNESVTEACLYLNVWAPLRKGEVDPDSEDNLLKDNKKAVMVLIHGGLFTIGSTGIDEYDGRMLAATGDVIVITIQYRLGIFGFLDLDTDEVPGNMGLVDQYTAIKWVSENAQHFGGDPELITLFGTSAGAISIGFHMFSPKAGPLFRRAILQSGSPMLLKQVYNRGEALAEKFASMVGCFKKKNETGGESNSIYDDPEPVVACLDQVPFETIYKVQGELVENNPVPFMPTIPSEYIDTFINDYNESMVLNQKEVLMGK